MAMTDSNFMDSAIIIVSVNDDGCTGFVYNKIFQQPLNALSEFNHIRNFPLYEGGPVDKEHLFFIHKRNDLITGGEEIGNDLYLGGDFPKAVALINSGKLGENDIKIFIGYCGWDAGELEAEINEGSWIKLAPPIPGIL